MEINKLAQYILEYDSDTFCASGSDINKKELKLILDRIYDNIIENHLDGVWLSQMLEEIRDIENDPELEQDEHSD